MAINYSKALIVGSGSGLSASLARLFARDGFKVALAARKTEKLAALCSSTGATAFSCDVSDPDQVSRLFQDVDNRIGAPDVVVFNASARSRGPFISLDAAGVEAAIRTSAFGGFLVAQQAAKRMVPQGAMAQFFLPGASASVKGYAQSAPFAMGKFALRGLAQSMARELAPLGIHVAHFIIDGAIRNPGTTEPPENPDSMLNPDAIAPTTCMSLASPAAPGRGRWNSGHGSKNSDSQIHLSVGRDGENDCGEVTLDQRVVNSVACALVILALQVR